MQHPKITKIISDQVRYENNCIISKYPYHSTHISFNPQTNSMEVKPVTEIVEFKTQMRVPKTGILLIGWGGNNGTTFTASILANRKKLSWETKNGVQEANFFGSMTQSSTVRIGSLQEKEFYVPLKDLVPMVKPEELVIGGWDISSMNLADAMKRAKVLDIALQQKLREEMSRMIPMKGIYRPDFIASNQEDRADNILPLDMPAEEQIQHIRNDIRQFKAKNNLEKVIVLWTANTERFCDVKPGLNGTAKNLLASIHRNEKEISPSTMYCVAAVLEGCSYVNGSPQNTLVPGVVELAKQKGVYVSGDDFKSGQTKLKSVLVDFFVQAGLKPTAIVSYNHLGNNDGKNLSSPLQFRSKEISKSNVVDDMVASNHILYKKKDEHPDHCVVIKYVPYVGDSKRALDEYTCEIFMGGTQTIVIHNTCEDSLLAAPLMIDLVVLTEFFERVSVRCLTEQNGITTIPFEKFDTVLSLLSYFLKAPQVPEHTPLVNALSRQRSCIENILKACIGLPADSNMLLEGKLPTLMAKNHEMQMSAKLPMKMQEVKVPDVVLDDTGKPMEVSQS